MQGAVGNLEKVLCVQSLCVSEKAAPVTFFRDACNSPEGRQVEPLAPREEQPYSDLRGWGAAASPEYDLVCYFFF